MAILDQADVRNKSVGEDPLETLGIEPLAVPLTVDLGVGKFAHATTLALGPDLSPGPDPQRLLASGGRLLGELAPAHGGALPALEQR